MTARAHTLPAIAARRESCGPLRVVPALLAGGFDALAGGVLLAIGPQSEAAAVVAAVVLHLSAALLLGAWRSVQPARRALAAIAVLAMPCAGAAIAAAVLATRGRGSAVFGHDREPRPRPAPAVAASLLAGHCIPLSDALLDGGEEERLAALAALIRRADPEAFALLRWAAAGRDPELALLAALALDEVDELTERRERPRAAALQVRHAAV